jgi:hypothetical protein
LRAFEFEYIKCKRRPNIISKEPKFAITNLQTHAQMQAKTQTDVQLTDEHGTRRLGPVRPGATLRYA